MKITKHFVTVNTRRVRRGQRTGTRDTAYMLCSAKVMRRGWHR